MILTIDIGNTRIKSASWHAGVIVHRAAHAYEVGEYASAFDEVFTAQDRPSRVLAVCVAGEEMQMQLNEWVMRHWQLEVEYLRTQKRYKNIVHAYNNPDQHGVDRWVGIVAAHQAYPGDSVCVISAGTATTFDLIDESGKHLGGYILPSYVTMRASLLTDTAKVSSVLNENFSDGEVPDNTSDAVNQGCHKLLQAGIREICAIAQNEMSEPIQIIVTGGYAEVILKYPNMPTMQHEPDLVMQGVYGIAMDQQNSGAGT